ncbi:hypothetical protein H7U32_07555 [Bifidobacterium pullorum subsp. saeculare]|uniref:Uncharacterized protein n=1 Tax=Bifidobacterium pullorum subsp. saeculare TaxID=78257 RepID=A0A938X0P5_9BIFI|nr:hypothetical protein [Bifidobacterium pullorum]MBM6700152.1 hypothetical protein [Bifidobacterium pullorum subsp. saeculare]
MVRQGQGNGTGNGYFAYAELLYTLALVMWFTAFHTAVTDVNRTPRIVELVLFAVIAAGCLAIAVVKARMAAKDVPWLWKAAVGYALGLLVVLAVLGGFGIVRLLAIVAWIGYQCMLIGAFKR